MAWVLQLPADLNYSLGFSLVGCAATALLVLLITPLGLQEADGGQAWGKGRALCRSAAIQKLPIVEQSVWHSADAGMAPGHTENRMLGTLASRPVKLFGEETLNNLVIFILD